jgi:signal transduction histidine kinase
MTATTTTALAMVRVRRATVVVFVIAAMNAAFLALDLWLLAVCRNAGIGGQGWVGAVASSAAIVIGSGVGATIAARLPRHPVGWLVLAGSGVFAASGALELYARASLLAGRRWAGGAVAGALAQSLWLVAFGVLALMVLLFPAGRPPAGLFWSRVARAVSVVFPVTFAVSVLATHGHLDAPLAAVSNPLAIKGLDTRSVQGLNLALYVTCLALLLACVVSVGVRYRTAEPAQRAQLKWVLLAGYTLPATVLTCLAVGIFSSDVGNAAGSAGFVVMLLALPIAMALAIGRYRLYSVDRFIDSALVHLALTMLLLGLYAAIVLGSSNLAGNNGSRSPVVVAVATLLVAAVAAPLRRRMQIVVNRRFHRRTFDAINVVEDYVRRLRDERALLSELPPMLSRAVGDPTLELGLWQADESAYFRLDGTSLPPVDPSRSLFHVARDGAKVAVLVHDPALDTEPLLLDSVMRAAALPLDNARLQAEVLVRLEEVRASRQRIVAAAYEERRRIERDLHDGAQQRLVSLALSLQLARQHLRGKAADVLDQAAGELAGAVREVRELARGIHPPTLTEDGLAGALEVLADRTPLAVVVDVPDEQLPDDVAAAAYFTACESVTNAVKHAGAKHVAIRAVLDAGLLTLEVSDDGCGGATLRPGGGLQGLADRVEALGGHIDVSSSPDVGTVVRTVLPCAL